MKKLLFHKYQLVRQIGAGGAGRVYLAFDKHLEQFVAVKESSENLTLAEMRLLREFKHPGLPEIYDYWKEGESAFLVMEYIEGMTLRQYLDRHERVEEQQAVCWVMELCRILRYLHERHPAVIYRDLKPENIMVRKDGSLKLIDLGGAVRYACGREKTDLCAGTAGYCPKEQWKETRGDVTWDIYALGVIFHEMLSGASPRKPPYERRSLSEYDRSIPKSLDRIIAGCMAGKEGGGYSQISQVEEALLQYRKQDLWHNLWDRIRRMVMGASALFTLAAFALPLLSGVPEEQFPFPYLKKPLAFLLFTFVFYLISFKLKFQKNYLQKQEKNIWLTQKQFPGLLVILLLFSVGILGMELSGDSDFSVCGGETEKLWVEMRDEEGRKLLLKNDAVYVAEDCVRFELPADRLPEGELFLQMVAVSEHGDVSASRIFKVRAEEDLN